MNEAKLYGLSLTLMHLFFVLLCNGSIWKLCSFLAICSLFQSSQSHAEHVAKKPHAEQHTAHKSVFVREEQSFENTGTFV